MAHKHLIMKEFEWIETYYKNGYKNGYKSYVIAKKQGQSNQPIYNVFNLLKEGRGFDRYKQNTSKCDTKKNPRLFDEALYK